MNASDKKSLIKIASGLPKGDETRKAILAGLKKISMIDLQDTLKSLEDLSELSTSISEVVNTFSLHFKTAAEIPTEISSQLEAVGKSREGATRAEAILKGLQEFTKMFPEDKTAQRALSDAQTLVNRFTKQKTETTEMIKKLSKKQLPDTLKKMAKTVEDGIKAKLTDPNVLQVIPWTTLGVNYQTRQKGAIYQAYFRIKDAPNAGNQVDLSLQESTVHSIGPYIGDHGDPKATTAKIVIDTFLTKLEGYPGLKGSAEKGAVRAQYVSTVTSALNAVCRARGFQTDQIEISSDNRVITKAYRSDLLPKEGASDVGEREYSRMTAIERAAAKKIMDANLTHISTSIKSIDISMEEKSWVYITVTLN